MTLVYFGIALWGAVIINAGCKWLAARMDRPLTDVDLYCAKVDRELDDELAARRATRPAGNCDVIRFPRERTRGDVA